MSARGLAIAMAVAGMAAPAAAGTIRGHVFEAKSGRPIGQARAFIMNANLLATTDSTGQFVLENVPSGDPVVRVQASWHEIWQDSVRVSGASDVVDLKVPLTRVPIPATLTGMVISEGGNPVRHAHVRVNGIEQEQMTDDDGTFAFYGAPPRVDTLTVSALSFDPVRTTVVGEEARTTAVVVNLGRSLLAGGRGADPPLRSPGDTVACIRFALPDTGNKSSKSPNFQPSVKPRLVTLDILEGERTVRKLMWWKTLPSEYVVAWDGRDDAGQAAPAGKYRYRLRFDSDPPIEGEINKP